MTGSLGWRFENAAILRKKAEILRFSFCAEKNPEGNWGVEHRRRTGVLSGEQALLGRKHPSRDVIFSGQNLAKKCQKLSLYMTSSNL